jgi:hypothetical protein
MHVTQVEHSYSVLKIPDTTRVTDEYINAAIDTLEVAGACIGMRSPEVGGP